MRQGWRDFGRTTAPPMPQAGCWNDALERDVQRLKVFGDEFDGLQARLEGLRTEVEVLERFGQHQVANALVTAAEALIGGCLDGLERNRPIRDVARITGYSREHLYHLIDAGALPRRSHDGQLALSVLDIRKYRRSGLPPAERVPESSVRAHSSPDASLLGEKDPVQRIRGAKPLAPNTEAA